MCVSGACAFALQADVSSGRASVFGGRGAGSVSSSGQMGVPVDLAVYLNSFMSIPEYRHSFVFNQCFTGAL